MESLVYNKAFSFAILIVNLYRQLRNEKNEFVLSKQVLRSGTSIGANIKEAIQAASKKDFLMKMNIALKEASETEYWLELIKSTNFLTEEASSALERECKEINKMLASIVKTTKEKLKIETLE